MRDDNVFHLLLDVEVLLGLMTALPATDKRRQRLLRAIETAFNALDLYDVAIGSLVRSFTFELRSADGAIARAAVRFACARARVQTKC